MDYAAEKGALLRGLSGNCARRGTRTGGTEVAANAEPLNRPRDHAARRSADNGCGLIPLRSLTGTRIGAEAPQHENTEKNKTYYAVAEVFAARP